jgi:uncharacterized protein YybS (DUF2232 family)
VSAGAAAIATVRGASFSGLAFLLGGLVPVAGGLAMMLAPLPILRDSLGMPGAGWRLLAQSLLAALIVTAGAGVTPAMAYLATAGVAVLAMGYLLGKRAPFEVIVLVATLLVLSAATLAAMAQAGGPAALKRAIGEAVSAGIDQGAQLSSRAGLGLQPGSGVSASLAAALTELAPALAAISVGFGVAANLALFWIWGGRERLDYPLIGDLARWSLPDSVIWLFVAAGFGLFAPWKWVGSAARNAFLCLSAAYFCQGLAIVVFHLKKAGLSRFWRLPIYAVVVLQPVLAGIVCATGLFDLWIDFRRIRRRPQQDAGRPEDFF